MSEFILGLFDDNATSSMLGDQTVKEETSPSGTATRYHAHHFTGGTPCDLTGRNRSTEVRFVCAPDAGGGSGSGGAGSTAPAEPPAGKRLVSGDAGGAPGVQPPSVGAHFVESIKEPTTCHYVLTLATPALCAHAAFRQDEPTVAHIRCIPLIDEAVDDHTSAASTGRDRAGRSDDGEL